MHNPSSKPNIVRKKYIVNKGIKVENKINRRENKTKTMNARINKL